MRISSLRAGKHVALALASLTLLSATIAGCGGDDNADATKSATATVPTTTSAASTKDTIPPDIGKNDKADLTGAGATFPAPIYQAWFADYNQDVAHGVKINYQGIGSGGGIQQFEKKTVDFAATDAPMSDTELAASPDAQHIPTVLGSVVVTYQVDGLSSPLKFDGPTLASIYLGEITKWSDPAIAALNSGVKLPDKDIQVVHRSDGSGTSYVFTDFLAKTSPDWKAKIGANKNPNWPAGQGGKGNDGVTTAVKQTPNSIGYVELNYAISNKLSYADIKNKAGKFIAPTLDSTTAAAAKATLPDDYRVSITDADGDDAYPISTFTYILLYKSSGSCAQQRPIVNFMWWVMHDASAAQTAKELNYAPLPESTVAKVESTLKSLTCEGKPTLGGQ